MIADARGLTIVEVLVASVILAIGIVGVMIIAPIASHGLRGGGQVSTATFLAEERLEEARNAAWQSTNPTDPSSTPVDCLGLSIGDAAPTSTQCRRARPTSCSFGTACTTFEDETTIAGHAGYGRAVRVTDCALGGACGGAVDSAMRRVSVTVTHAPLTGAGMGTQAKVVGLDLLVARR